MKTKLLIIALLSSISLFSQVGIGTTNPQGALDITSTNDGLLIPRIALSATNVATVVTPTVSELVYNTTTSVVGPNQVTPGYYYWNGTAWIRLLSAQTNDWSLIGNAGTNATTNFLGTTDNVSLNFRTNNTERFRIPNANQVFAMADGTAALPFYSWNADSDSGMYRISANTLGFSTNALERFKFSAASAIFNDIAADYDFQVKSLNRTHMFFVDASTNRIGINNNTPLNPVHFKSAGENSWLTFWENATADGAPGQFINTNSTNGNRVLMGVTNYNASAYEASGVIGISLNNNGSGGIGVYGASNSGDANAIEGSLTFTGIYSGWGGYFNADVNTTGGYFTISDSRFKKDIKPINQALTLISKIEPVSYFYDTEKYPNIGLDQNRLSYGFIAQDLEKIIPEMVKNKNIKTNSNKKKDTELNSKNESEIFKVVNYTLLIPILTEAIKEQQVIIENQEARILKLEKLVEELLKK